MSLTIFEEYYQVEKNLHCVHQLLKSKKISTKEKLDVLKDVNIDVGIYLMSIGEEVDL